MRRYCSLISLVIIFLCTAGPALAAPARIAARASHTLAPFPRPSFDHLTIEDGLSQNAVLAILQDRQGYLWLGTQDGLNRYDGYTFTTYRHAGDLPTSLSNSSVLALAEDPAGILWVGTWGGGLNRFDPVTGVFSAYRHDPDDPTSLADDTVTDLLIGRDGAFWVATLGGLDRFDPVSGAFTHFRSDPADPASLSGDNISVLFEDSHGSLWVGTGFGAEGSGLNRFNPASGTAVRFQNDPANPNSLSSNNIASLYEDPRGQFWVGTGGYSLPAAGLNRFDPASGTAERFQNDPADPHSLSNDNVMSIWQAPDGWLWVATWGGLNLFNPSAAPALFERVLNDPFDPASLSADILWSIYADRSGVVWVGTLNGGVSKFNPRRSQFRLYHHNPADPDSLGFNVISSFYEDRQGGFWVGTWGGGLNYWDRATDRFSAYLPDPQNPASFPSTHANCIFEDSRGILWVGSTAASHAWTASPANSPP